MARFLPDSSLLIQHVPRTGGTFVEEAIDTLGIKCQRWMSKQPKSCPKKHSLLSHYSRAHMRQVKFIACFVRHPVNYYVSVWRYLHESRLASQYRLSLLWTKWSWHPFRQAALLYKPDFAEWVDALIEAEPAWATRLMCWYVGPQDGEFCDFIGRTETVRTDLAQVLIHLNYQVDPIDLLRVPRANQSSVPTPAIPDDLRERICREERVLIRRFYSEDTIVKRWYGTGSA